MREMSKCLIGSAALFCAGTALAADLPDQKSAPVVPIVPPAVFSWTGFYVGANGGWGLDHFAFPYNTGGSPTFVTGTSGITSGGAVIGGQIGFNYELTNLAFIGHAVIGVEADSDWSGITGSSTVSNGPYTATFGTRVENFGTLRSRLGYNFDRLLLYFTAGLSYMTVNTNTNVNGPTASNTVTRSAWPLDVGKVGVVGIGAEYAVTNNITVKAEYLYDWAGARWETFALAPGTAIDFNTRSMYHIARVGVNYKFDWFSPPTPVDAKY